MKGQPDTKDMKRQIDESLAVCSWSLQPDTPERLGERLQVIEQTFGANAAVTPTLGGPSSNS